MMTPLGTLLKESYTFVIHHAKPVLIGSVIFGVLLGSMQYVFERKMMVSVSDHVGKIEHMEDLADRMEAGDEKAFEEMMMELGLSEDGTEVVDPEKSEELASNFVKGVLPSFIGFSVMLVLVSIISNIYFLLLTIRNSQDAGATFVELKSYIFPMFGLWIWMSLRSFIWIPFIGVIFAIVIGPRLMLAPVILVRERKGVMESTKLSLERTKGYWGTIVGNLFVMSLCLWVALVVSAFITTLVTASVPLLSVTLLGVLQYVVLAFGTTFTVKLSDAIIASPRRG